MEQLCDELVAKIIYISTKTFNHRTDALNQYHSCLLVCYQWYIAGTQFLQFESKSEDIAILESNHHQWKMVYPFVPRDLVKIATINGSKFEILEGFLTTNLNQFPQPAPNRRLFWQHRFLMTQSKIYSLIPIDANCLRCGHHLRVD